MQGYKGRNKIQIFSRLTLLSVTWCCLPPPASVVYFAAPSLCNHVFQNKFYNFIDIYSESSLSRHPTKSSQVYLEDGRHWCQPADPVPRQHVWRAAHPARGGEDGSPPDGPGVLPQGSGGLRTDPGPGLWPAQRSCGPDPLSGEGSRETSISGKFSLVGLLYWMWGKIILVKLVFADQKARNQILGLKQENANLQSKVSLSFGLALPVLCSSFVNIICLIPFLW